MAETLLPQSRLGKARAQLPEEYNLAQFLSDVDNTHPSWNRDTPVCEWDRVRCNARGEILRIGWTSLSLSGTPRWVHLSSIKCTEIFLANNNLLGQIVLKWLPPNIIIFSGRENKFGGSINLDELPEQLDTLHLGRCNLHGSISLHALPAAFMLLHLEHNKLSGCLDFRALPSTIKVLNFSNNNFSGPVDLQNLPYNIILWLDNNPNLIGEYDPIRFKNHIGNDRTGIKKLPKGGSLECFLPLRYVFDSDVWDF